MGRTLNDFLSQAGVKVAAAQPAAPAAATSSTPAPAKTAAAAPAKTAPAAAAPAKTASGDIAPNQPSKGEAAGGHKPREKKTEMEQQNTGAGGGDAAGSATPGTGAKTAQQLALARKGIIIDDAKLASITYDALVRKVEAEKTAEAEKVASELRAQGALMYQGMIQESTAWKLATGEAEVKEAHIVAAGLGISADAIIKRAEQIGGAMSSPALVGGMLGSAARTDSSKVMEAGERNGSTTETRNIDAIAGTRGPVSGVDDKLKRFTDVATLPGNPGLNHGQVVDQGKKLGE